MSQIQVPGLVVHAEDDPFIPPETVTEQKFPPGVALEMISHGGHLGYVSRRPWEGDHRWLESRLLAWLADRWAEKLPKHPSTTRTPQGGLFAHEFRPA